MYKQTPELWILFIYTVDYILVWCPIANVCKVAKTPKDIIIFSILLQSVLCAWMFCQYVLTRCKTHQTSQQFWMDLSAFSRIFIFIHFITYHLTNLRINPFRRYIELICFSTVNIYSYISHFTLRAYTHTTHNAKLISMLISKCDWCCRFLFSFFFELSFQEAV